MMDIMEVEDQLRKVGFALWDYMDVGVGISLCSFLNKDVELTCASYSKSSFYLYISALVLWFHLFFLCLHHFTPTAVSRWRQINL